MYEYYCVMGDQSPISDWKLSFGTADQIREFEKQGKSYLQKYGELFDWYYKLSQLAKKGYRTDTLEKNLEKIYENCRDFVHFYLFGSVFFMDIDARVTLEHLNKIQKAVMEMIATNQMINNGLTQIFLAYTFKELGESFNSNRAFEAAKKFFPISSRFAELAQKSTLDDTSLKEWITIGIDYYNIPSENLLIHIQTNAGKIDEKEFQDEISSEVDNISVEDYEKKFLEHYSEQKNMKLHVRRCSKCNLFMTSEDIMEKKCPRCNAPMSFALYCSTCGIWYTVKTHRKYLCPTCGNYLIKKELVK